jgi:signal transduction histidine kinase
VRIDRNLDTWLARLRTTRLDAGLAVGFVLAGLAQTMIWPIATRGIAEVYVVGSLLPLAWRRTFPVESALVAASFWLIPLDGYPLLGFVAVVLQFFALGHRGTSTRGVAATTVVASVLSVMGTLVGPEAPVAAIGAVLVVVAPVLAGRLVRHQQQQADALARLARELQAERTRAEEAAVGMERARIAQELHDVVGHELTLIAIQAEAAGAALKVSPERAAAPVEAIRVTAHHTLAEIRGVLEVLSPAGENAAPGSEPLEALVARARSAGIPGSLVVSGVPLPDASPVALAVARIVRECLTNAGRHAAGAPVAVRVDWQPSRVHVRASNPMASRGRVVPGRGLTGIRHRAELLGGTYTAGVTDGIFAVDVWMPTGAAT